MSTPKTQPREVSEDLKAKQAEQEIQLEYMEKEYPVFGLVRIHHPSLQVSTEIDNAYYEKFNELLANSKLPTLSEMDDILEERGTWGEEQEEKLSKLLRAIKGGYYDIEQLKLQRHGVKGKGAAKRKKEYEEAIIEKSNQVKDYNVKYIQLMTRKNRLYEATIEKRVEQEIVFYKIFRCTTDVDGNPVWDSVEDLKKVQTRLLQELAVDATKFWEGVTDPLFAQSLDAALGS